MATVPTDGVTYKSTPVSNNRVHLRIGLAVTGSNHTINSGHTVMNRTYSVAKLTHETVSKGDTLKRRARQKFH